MRVIKEAVLAPGPVWMGMEKRNLFSAPGFEHRAVQTVASRYTTALSCPPYSKYKGKKEGSSANKSLQLHRPRKCLINLSMKVYFPINKQPQIFDSQCYLYRVAHEKPARRLVDQRGCRSRTLYRKLNKCKCKVLTG